MASGGRPAADLLVALVVTPLLVVLGLLLQSNLQGDWASDPQRRWNVLGLGLGLLFVSLLMCCYVTHRLGICLWEAQHRIHPPPPQVEVLVPQDSMAAVGSQMQLVVRADPPPSYESVATCDTPPPYCAVVVYGQAAVTLAARQAPGHAPQGVLLTTTA